MQCLHYLVLGLALPQTGVWDSEKAKHLLTNMEIKPNCKSNGANNSNTAPRDETKQIIWIIYLFLIITKCQKQKQPFGN